MWGTNHIERDWGTEKFKFCLKFNLYLIFIISLFIFSNIYFYFIWLLWALVAACGIYFPDQGPWHWKLWVLVTGPPGKSLILKKKRRKWMLMVRSHKTGQKHYWRTMIPVHYKREPIQTEIPVHCFFSPLSYWRGKDWAEWGWEMALRRKLSPVLEIKLSSFIRVLLYNYVPSIV